MKKFLLTVLVISAGTISINAQTKGTNALGFGVTSQKTEVEWKGNEYNEPSFDKQKQNNYSLTYGRFIKDNTRLGITGSISNGEQENSHSSYKFKGYGVGMNYQRYYPLLKKFYAFAGGSANFFHTDIKNYGEFSGGSGNSQQYGIGANGGAAYFLSKRFAFEVQLV
ncbi:MAG TPA: hypothetical protein VF602_11950, partial [Pedobacter sp.]